MIEKNDHDDNLINVYKAACNQLENIRKRAGLSEKELEVYFTPEHIFNRYNEWELKSPKDDICFVMCRFCESLQNSSHMRNSIKFSKNFDQLLKITENFNPVFIEGKGYETLLQEFEDYCANPVFMKKVKKKRLKMEIEENDNNNDKARNNWEKYALGVWEASKYFNTIKIDHPTKSFREYADDQGNDIFKKLLKIPGLGDALASDFLKEIGCIDNGKPDVHIKAVYAAFNGVNEDDVNKNNNDDVRRFLTEMAAANRESDNTCTVYKIDKVLWLICANPPSVFYVNNDRLSDKERYLKKVREIVKVEKKK